MGSASGPATSRALAPAQQVQPSNQRPMRYVCASYMVRAVQQKRSMVQSGTIRGVDVNTMQEFIAIVLATKERAKLPPDAKWYILHPDGRKITYWDTSMRILAAFYFWQVCGTSPPSVHWCPQVAAVLKFHSLQLLLSCS